MLASIKMPPRIINGRLEVCYGTDQNANILRQICTSGATENPFLDVGIGLGVFQTSPEAVLAQVRDQIRRRVAPLEDSGRLRVTDLSVSGDSGNVTVSLTWIDGVNNVMRNETFTSAVA